MIQQKIRLRSAWEIQRFIRMVDMVPYQVELCPADDQDFVFRASSVIGICSLDLSSPLLLRADTDDREAVRSAFEEYLL